MIKNRAFFSYDTAVVLPGDSLRRVRCRTRVTSLAPNLKVEEKTFHIFDMLKSEKAFEIISPFSRLLLKAVSNEKSRGLRCLSCSHIYIDFIQDSAVFAVLPVES